MFVFWKLFFCEIYFFLKNKLFSIIWICKENIFYKIHLLSLVALNNDNNNKKKLWCGDKNNDTSNYDTYDNIIVNGYGHSIYDGDCNNDYGSDGRKMMVVIIVIEVIFVIQWQL